MAPRVNIRPSVSVLAILRHLNYKPWHALGEFVDNSVQSFLKNKVELKEIQGEEFKLLVEITIDSESPARISVRDNAAGISKPEYARAFRPAEIPPDRTGLAEFGMGMKSAACWFAPRWSVRTSALGEPVTREVSFDIGKIVNDDINELTVEETTEDADTHFTEITLVDIFQEPKGRTVAKLKEHLTDMYRVFMRDGILELRFNDKVLEYQKPGVLKAPYFKDKGGLEQIWQKDIRFDLGNGLSAHGFAALREKANTARAGFALFRRGRLIQGSGDEGYRPHQIFGAANSFRYQRLFGELHLEGFDVSHTKDGFRWDENEEPFLDLLYEHLDNDDLPLLKQADGYRVRASKSKLKKTAQEVALSITKVLEEHLPEALPAVIDAQPIETPSVETPPNSPLVEREFIVPFRDRDWLVKVEYTNDQTEGVDWVSEFEVSQTQAGPRRIGVRVSMAHPFMVRFAQTNADVSAKDVEGLLRVAAAIVLARVTAQQSGVRSAGTVLRNVNTFLGGVLSNP